MSADAVAATLVAQEAEIRARLDQFIRLPSVSTDPAYAEGMRGAQQFLLSWLREIGLHDVQLLDGGGHPAIYGAWTGAPGKPTILIYGHYDVQPPDPVAEWASPPFEPTERDGCLFGRGASDDKGSSTIAIAAVAAFLQQTGVCPVNVKLFLEGEEEIGSPSLPAIVARHRDLLRADAMLSADGGRASRTIPTINVGARGNTGMEIKLNRRQGPAFRPVWRRHPQRVARDGGAGRHAARSRWPHRGGRLLRRGDAADAVAAATNGGVSAGRGRVLR